MRLMAILLALSLTSCTGLTAQTFYQGTFDQQKTFCKEHEKELLHDTRTQIGHACVTKAVFEAYKRDEATCKSLEGRKFFQRFWPLGIDYHCWTESEYAAFRQQEAEQLRYQAQIDASRAIAAGMILQGFALRGGPLSNTLAAPPPTIQPPPAFVPVVPSSPPMPPISCTSRNVGGTVYTDCY